MALYINGRPVNPIVTFLVSAVVIAGIIGLGVLLLPVIGVTARQELECDT